MGNQQTASSRLRLMGEISRPRRQTANSRRLRLTEPLRPRRPLAVEEAPAPADRRRCN